MRRAPLVLLVLLAIAPLALAQELPAELPPSGSAPPGAPTTGGAQGAPAEADDPAGIAPITGGSDPLFGDLDLTTGIFVGVGLGVVAAAVAFFFLGGAKFVNSGNVLENEARRTIFEYIQQHPGVHLRAAATQLNLSTTNVLWHLRKLEDANLVTSKKFEGYKVFYPVEGGVETKRRAIASSVLKNENAAHILEYVASNPSAHQREIARALGVNHGTIRWHLRKLEEAELLSPVRKEHTTHYYVSDLGRSALGGFAARITTPPAPPVPPTAGVPDEPQA